MWSSLQGKVFVRIQKSSSTYINKQKKDNSTQLNDKNTASPNHVCDIVTKSEDTITQV